MSNACGSCYARNWNAGPCGSRSNAIFVPQGSARIEMVSEPLSSRVGADKEVLGKSHPPCSSYPINLSSQPLTTLSSPYKKVSLRWDVKTVFEGTQPTAFSGHRHLNKAPIKIQSLSLLISPGSYKRHQWLFWFHSEVWAQRYGRFL